MNNGEPIPGATPPDAIKPPEPTPPSPEGGPKGGVKVECRQPELIYSLARGIVDGTEKHSKEVSNTQFGDSIIGQERTDISGFEATKGSGERIDGTFHYDTWIDLSGERVAREDHGYFSNEKVDRINAVLTQLGAKTVVDHEAFWGNQNRIVIEKDGYFIEAHFGWNSRQAEEAIIMAEVEGEKTRGKEGYATKYELPRIAQGLENKSIGMTLVDRQRAKDGWEGYPKLQDQGDFTRATQAYTETYQQVLQALYAEEGITPKDNTVVLRPPVLNSDAFTQIKSTESSSPTIVTPEQLKTEHVGFNEIAGQDFAVSEAKRLVLAINHPEVFEKRGVKRPKGILFYGPPGTGKTLIAKAVATEANAAFLEISAADVGTKWYGESERLMQKVFDIANDTVAKGQKVVIFFDELDSLAPSREDAHEATRKVVATLLQNMDGMRSNPNVTIIAATNRPQDIDPALKRPGRIDKLIPVVLPAADGRASILKVHMEKAKKAAGSADDLFSQEIDVAQLGQVTEGMSGADLANLVNLTLEEKTMAELEGQSWTPISTEDMVSTAKRLGLLKEEKRRIGFLIPEKNGNGGNGNTPTAVKQ